MSIPYEQLTFTNQFMFEKVLTCPENKNIVRRIIEMAIGEEVEDIQLVQSENSIQIYHDSKGVRFDVYLKTLKKYIDIELQTIAVRYLDKRHRYYHSNMDLDQLGPSMKYESLKASYVIFILLEDPYKLGLPVYHIQSKCLELPDLKIEDERYTVYMNTTAMNVEDPDLKEFYNYIQTHEATGTFTREIEQKVQELRKDKYIRSQYMQLEELMQAREEQGVVKGIQQGSAAEKEKICIALLKKNMDISFIQDVTGMDEKTIQKLARESGRA